MAITPKIHLLSPELQNQIAAGEVVERPASVLKELVENSLDAQATRITIQIRDGGQSFIEVSDDGLGIAPEDLELALTRHATSKLFAVGDLQKIKSFGFRGEALPSIASVSRFHLASAIENGQGQILEMAYGRVVHQGQGALPRGTTIQVSDLFANVPARLKFLKTPSTEARRCVDIVSRMALAHLDVDFEFIQGQRQVFHFFKDQTLQQRLALLWPQTIVEGLREFSSTDSSYGVYGLAGDPATAQGRAQRIFVFVNNRPVQDKTILSAVREAYRGKILGKEYPQAVVFLNLPAQDIDVNVHPAKTEIRFQDEGAIFRLVRGAIARCWEQNLADSSSSMQTSTASRPALVVTPMPALDLDKKLEKRSPGYPDVEKFGTSKRAQQLFEDFSDLAPVQSPDLPATLPEEVGFSALGSASTLQYLWQFQRTYLLLIEGQELVLLDQHAAHERILFAMLQSQGQRGDRQPLLIPLELSIHPSQSEALQNLWGELRALGFDLELSSPTKLLIKAIPPLLNSGTAREFIEDIASDKARSMEDMWALMACRGAVKAGDILTDNEALALIEAWNELPHKDYCPHGRPVALRWSERDLEKLFKRRG